MSKILRQNKNGKQPSMPHMSGINSVSITSVQTTTLNVIKKYNDAGYISDIKDGIDAGTDIAMTMVHNYRTLKAANDGDSDIKPPVLIIGETHPCPSDIVLQMGILQNLVANDVSTLFGCERPHNLFLSYLHNNVEAYNPHKLKIRLPIIAQSKLNLSALFGKFSIQYAPVTSKMFLNFLSLNQNIQKVFNDLSRVKIKGQDYLDNEDTETHKHLLDNGIDKERLSATSTKGMDLRNSFMVKKAGEAVKTFTPDIFIQHCGNHHIAGTPTHNQYAHSLHYYFTKAGFDTYFIHSDNDKTQREYINTLPLSTHGLNNLDLPRNKYYNEKIWKIIPQQWLEKHFTKKMLNRAGLDQSYLNFKDNQKDAEEKTIEIFGHYFKLINHYSSLITHKIESGANTDALSASIAVAKELEILKKPNEMTPS